MALVGYESIAPLASMELPGLPSPVLLRFLNLAALQLCNESQAWQDDIAIAGVADQATYALALPAPAELIAVRALLINGIPIKMTSKAALDLDMPGWESAPSGNVSRALVSPSEIRLIQAPAQACSITARVALRPRADATQIDDALLSRYHVGLTDGAKSMAMAIPNKDWSNPVLAMEYKASFRAAIDRARIENIAGFANGALRMQPRRFGD